MYQTAGTGFAITGASSRPAATTRALLALGIVAGPVYVSVSLLQAFSRDGFDPARHQWSLLANGDLGWIHIANLVLAGLLTVGLATGLHRTIGVGRSGSWAPRLIGAYGLGLVGAGVFRADPATGFPPGTPEGTGEVTWHGVLHFTFAGIGFLCLVGACFALARRFAAEGRPTWAAASRATGVLFLTGFAAAASGGQNAVINLAFTAAVVIAWTWLSAVARVFYRRATAE